MEILTKKEQAVLAELAPTLWFEKCCNPEWLAALKRTGDEPTLGRMNLQWLIAGRPYICFKTLHSPQMNFFWHGYTNPVSDLFVHVAMSPLSTRTQIWDLALTFKMPAFYSRVYVPNKRLLAGMLPEGTWEELLK